MAKKGDLNMSTAAEHDVARQPLLDEEAWEALQNAIRYERCAPFVGPELIGDRFPSRATIAGKWAVKKNYPLRDKDNLPRVAQYLAIADPLVPLYEIAKELREQKARPAGSFDVYHALANLPLPLYVCTYYDNLMLEALQACRVCKPSLRICRWKKPSDANEDQAVPVDSPFDSTFSADVPNPVVFHLFGHISNPDSLVLTERDYVDFAISLAKGYTRLIPRKVDEVISRSYLLFLGYRLVDLDFLVLLCTLGKKLGTYKDKHIAVQLADVTSEEERADAEGYLRGYLKMFDVRVCFGTTEEFVEELDRRWRNNPTNPGRNNA